MAKKGATRGSKAHKRIIRPLEARPAEPIVAEREELEAARPVQAPTARPVSAPASSPYRPSTPVYRRVGQAATPVPTDYSYVRHDLQRMGVLVALIVVGLIALTFVLR
jgi:hypothetical protein